jgi:hypothetical protein
MKTGHHGTQPGEGSIGAAVAAAGLGRPSGAERAAPSPPAALQSALLFRPDGSAELTAEPARLPKRNHRGIRGDARRTAEYLASRGATPAEALHSVARLAWRTAVKELVKALRCTPLQAFELWRGCVVELLPYTASRFATLELGDNAAGGLALAHFLAASAMSDRLAAPRGQPVSTDGRSVDIQQTIDLASVPDAIPSEVTRGGLPPKAPD